MFAGKASCAVIIQPQDRASFALNESVTLQGKGADFEDVILPGTAYSWTSSQEGFLGTKSRLSVRLLPGVHRVMLTVTDRDKNMGTVSITIFVAIEECEGDFNKDGEVDGLVLAVFAADFGRTDCTVSP